MKKIYLLFLILIVCSSCSLFKLSSKKSSNIRIKIEMIEENHDLENKAQEFAEALIKENDIDINEDNTLFWTNSWKTLIEKFLRSQGYYNAKIEYQTINDEIIYKITPGAKYLIGNLEVKIYSNNSHRLSSCKILIPAVDSLQIKSNDPVIAEKIIDTQKQIAKYVEENNCLLNFDISHQASINHAQLKINIVFLVNAGPDAYFKNSKFEGLEGVNPIYAHKLVDKHIKGCFKYSKISKAKDSLQASALFSSVAVIVPKSTDKEGNVDITFKTKERKQRTIKAGVKYSTDLGPGITGSLEHRNLFGNGEKLTNNLSLTKSQKNLDTILQFPFFLNDAQTLKLQNIIEHENLSAYNNKEISLIASLEQVFLEKLTFGEGIKYGISKVEDDNGKKNYTLAAIPLFVKIDFRNNMLDPTKGVLLRASLTPYYNTLGNSKASFYKKELYASLYLGADVKLKPVLALLGQIGSISSSKTTNIPGTERFFSGGAGSIRGYKYQTVGPLNSKDDPIGGNSMIELSAEMRFRTTEALGFVLFTDAGNVFSSKSPKFKEKLLYSAGFGLRYYTSFGPLRADIAFPMKTRGKIDKSFQLYFSIGQAF